ncbi:hypothetical protein [Glaciihabitans sp. UYNi722]|uniref:hypothetical protein n=1 Tax=Glaciihabitans sp. UYNi722 TaxID=3156344 RepID=UPI00339B309D
MGTGLAERRRSGIRMPTIVGLAVGVVGIIAVFTIRAVTPALGTWSLPNQLQDLLTLSISVIVESLPFVILGILLSIVVQVWSLIAGSCGYFRRIRFCVVGLSPSSVSSSPSASAGTYPWPGGSSSRDSPSPNR